MNQALRLATFAFRNFGPLIVFYAANHFYGMRTAVIAAVLFGFAEIVLHLARKEKLTSFFKFTLLVTIVFGVLDLTMSTPVFFKFESAITNVITGIYFGMTLRGPKSFIQEFMEKRNGIEMTSRNAIFRCRIITIVWTTYFFLKAGFYAYVANRYSVEQAMMIRSTVGTASFYGLLGLSLFFGRKIVIFFQRNGLLPSYPEIEVTTASN